MRRLTKRFLVVIFGVLFTVYYCEFLIYYVAISQCGWPALNQSHKYEEPLRALILSDIHLLGPRKGHWLDKCRREWQMHRAFQTIIELHKPEVVFILGDLFDEGEWSNEQQFSDYVERFHKLFSLPENIKMHVVVGNHDIGNHNFITRGSAERFSELLNSPAVQLLTLKYNHFVLINSMAMHGDACDLCTEARDTIKNISEILSCTVSTTMCDDDKLGMSKRPVLLQHFPLYRESDKNCDEEDVKPLSGVNIQFRPKKFRQRIDVLSKEATEYLVRMIRPRVVFGGHTHNGCRLNHSYAYPDIAFTEYSVPSFSWRNRPDPKFMLVVITPDEYAINKCGLPKEVTIVISAAVMLTIIGFFIFSERTIGRRVL